MLCAKNRSKKHQIFEKWDHFENRPSCKGYSPCKILTFRQKLKFQKKCQNPFYKSFTVVLCKKTAPKNIKYSRNETILKIGHQEKTRALGKSSVWVKNENSKKHNKIHSTNHLELFCAKNRSKKHQIFEKWDHFENRPSCKGYSPRKILTLGQKLKFRKTCQNPFYKSFTVVLCKKNAPKNIKYSRNETILKIGHHAKALAHAKSSLWVKNWNSEKHVKIHSTNHLQLFCVKNCSKKHQESEKWDHFENRPSCVE